MKNKFKLLLQEKKFDEAKALVDAGNITETEANECLIETMTDYKKLLVEELDRLMTGHN